MTKEMMNTKEVAGYLGIHEKQVYALVREKRIPATRVTGKWVFPKKTVDEWLETHALKGMEQAGQKGARVEGALLAAGSNDPVVDMLQTHLRKVYPEFYIFSANTGSTEGLKALNKGYTDIAWSHLFDPQTGEYNIPFLPSLLKDINPVVVNLFSRELGFVVAPANPRGITAFADLTRAGITFVNRQAGAGTRILLDYHLEQEGIPAASVQGYTRELVTHFEVGLAVLAKEADVGIATGMVAKILGLDFVPITMENFDMVIDKSVFFEKGVQAFLEVLNSRDFKNRVGGLGNYDFGKSGRVCYTRH